MLPLNPVLTAPLFRPLLEELGELLRSLSAEDWNRGTVAGSWRVRDVAAHLLDGDLRKLAACRDDHLLSPHRKIASAEDLSQFINGLNASGVSYGARLSPRLLTDLLAVTGGWVADLVERLDPQGQACFPVTWAGESTSENWMDTGREYTERWHHQAQIRDAVGAPRLLEPRWLEPLMDLSVRSLPVAYAAVEAPDGTAVTLSLRATPESAWTVVRGDGTWRPFRGAPASPDARLTLDPDLAWRLFYNALPSSSIAASGVLEGDRSLLEPMLAARSVIL